LRRLLLIPVLLLCACKVATIRPIESQDTGSGPQEFDAVKYVESLWAEEMPGVLEQAVDLAELLPVVAGGADIAGARWGRREGNGPYHVIVKGSGRVLEVDLSSRTGIAVLQIETPEGPARARLQVGPVLQGTSIRDALPGVSFDQFVNQIQFADVANELNATAEREVLGALQREDLAGTSLRVVGMATLDGADGLVTVTPVRLEPEAQAER